MKLTVGRFIPASSPIHSLNPTSKALAVLVLTIGVIVSSGVFDYIVLFTALFVLMLSSRINLFVYLKGLKSIWMLIAFAVVVQLIYSGVWAAIESAVRISLILLFAEVLTFTTRPSDLASSLEDILRFFGVPLKSRQEFGMMMAIAMRFAPIMLSEVDRIVKAQISRGARIDSGRVWERMKSLVSITVPLMASAVRKAEEVAIALEARRFRPGVRRTRYRVYPWRVSEILIIDSALFTMILIVFFT